MITQDDFLKGAIGGTFVWALTQLRANYLEARKTNRTRKLIIVFLKQAVKNSLKELVKDYDYLILEVTNRGEVDIKGQNWAGTPSFTSELFKSYPKDELRSIFMHPEQYMVLITCYHAIDFINNQRPHDLEIQFTNKMAELSDLLAKQEAGTATEAQKVEANLRLKLDFDYFLRRSTRARETVLELDKAVDDLLLCLNGPNWMWFIYYLFRWG